MNLRGDISPSRQEGKCVQSRGKRTGTEKGIGEAWQQGQGAPRSHLEYGVGDSAQPKWGEGFPGASWARDRQRWTVFHLKLPAGL